MPKYLVATLILTLMAPTAIPARAADDILTKTLPNGTLWIHRPVRHNKIMAFHLFFPSGASAEPAGKAGLTTLMTSVMFKGTKKYSALNLARAVESLGAALDADADEDYWTISGQAISDNFEPLLEIFREVLLNPTFPEPEFEKEKEALLNAIRSKKEQIFEVAYELLQRELYGEHPYGRPEEGTAETVSGLEPADVVQWHRRVSVPKGTVLATAGSIPTAKLEKMVMKALDGWSGGAEPPARPGKARFPAKASVAQQKHPFEQSYLMTAFPAPAVGDGEYAAVKTLNALLGGGMSSPLFRVVREEGSLAYEVSSFYPTKQWGSSLTIYAGTDPQNLDLAEEKIRGLLKELLGAPFREEDIENAKRYIRGNYLMDHQTNSRLAWYLGWWEIMGPGHEFDRRYPDEIQSVTKAGLRRAAEHLFAQPATTVKIRSNKTSNR